MKLLKTILSFSSIFCFTGASAKKLTITGALGDTAWTGHPQTTVDHSYDGSYSTDLNNCYVTHNNVNAGARYQIANSLVSSVRILNRKDCCSERLAGAEITVCDEAETLCTSCGVAAATGAGQWADITCQSGAVGSIVRVIQPRDHFQTCEVEIFGEEAAAVNSAVKLDITGAFGDFAWQGHQETIVDNSYDGSYSLDYKQCFNTHVTKMASARYEIANSKVSSVKILNRFDCCPERLTGVLVYICDVDESTCNQCGTVGETGPGQWVAVVCEEPRVGTIVKVVAPNTHLQYCEIEVFGEPDATVSIVKQLSFNGAFGDAAWSGHPQTTFDKSYDGTHSVNLDNCYVTHTSQNAAVRYEVARSLVTAVRILNRYDCCSERLAGTQILVCEDETETACKTCGSVGVTGPGQWAVVVCLAGCEGSFVKIVNPKNTLQLCEVEILGTEKPTKPSPIKQIAITGSVGDAAEAGHPQTTIERSYDGTNSVELNDCYVTQSNKNAGGLYLIPSSLVSAVRILNRRDCCPDRLAGVKVSVCDETETSCIACGVAGVTGPGSWAVIPCTAGAVGTAVRIMSPNDHFQACEVEIFGQDAASVVSAIKKIKITGAVGDAAWSGHPQTTIENSFDESDSVELDDCYVTHSHQNAKGLYQIPSSLVSTVRILNRRDCCPERLTGTVVSVCDEAETSCNECGVAGQTGAGAWAMIQCAAGAVGTVVRIVTPNNNLQTCEVEVFGQDAVTAPSPAKIDIIGATGDAAWTGHPQTVVGNSCDGSYSVNLDDCYVTNTFKNAQAQYKIANSLVSTVKILNRRDCCWDRMKGTVVSICDDSGSTCNDCGTAETTEPGQWATIFCRKGTKGSTVKVVAPNTHLQACEVEVFGGSADPVTEAPTTSPTEAPTTTPTTTIAPTTTTTLMVATTTPAPTEPPTTTPTTTKATTSTVPAPLVCEPQFDDTAGQLEVSSCTSMEVKDQTRACENLFDGSLSRDVKEGVCFVTKSNYKGWLEVNLAKTSVVSKIVMLSKGNGQNLAGTIVSVCTDTKKSCQRFGKVYKVKPDKCTILKGETPLTGNMVRFFIEDSSLVICEMRIYGV